jgi:hypothetical protein
MKKSVPVNEITQTLQTAQSGLESLLSGQQDLRLNTGSSSVSEYAGTSASSTTRSGVSRRRGRRERRIQQETTAKQPRCTVDVTIGSNDSGQTLLYLDYTLLASSVKSLPYHSLLKILKKFGTLLLKDDGSWSSWEVSLQPRSLDTAPTSLNGAVITPPSPKTGPKSTKKRSSSKGKQREPKKHTFVLKK